MIMLTDYTDHCYSCLLCGAVRLKESEVEKHFKDSCPNFEVECPGCKLKGQRQFIEGSHGASCELITIQCDKCKLKYLRKDKSSHDCLNEMRD